MSDEVKWLIKDKFKDDEEGRVAMAKAYSEVQGKKDEISNELKEAIGNLAKTEGAVELNKFIKNDPQTLEYLKMRDQQLKLEKSGGGEVLVKPIPPKDLDSLDIGTPGTSTEKYMQDVREYDNAVLKQTLEKEFDAKIQKITDTISTNQKTTQSKAELHTQLKDFGLDDKGIVEYETFFADKENATVENTVKIFKLLTGKHVAISPEKLQEKGFPLSSIIPGAKDLVIEPNPEAKKEMDELMKLSNS
ncbi:hypothetical protein LCGC14_0364850 [marine sediment metagenome]|uniref:Uncharacterized protein n=1 Tax=marine sediment metagenome TaxID=412755 RepID=A0A0F9WFD5_9ZZZZ